MKCDAGSAPVRDSVELVRVRYCGLPMVDADYDDDTCLEPVLERLPRKTTDVYVPVEFTSFNKV